MDIKFDEKRVLVTGGGRGIGREVARRLVACGATTFVLEKCSTGVENLKREDPDIEVIRVDITDWDSTRKAVESILPIDFLVNNAGINRPFAFLDCKESDIDDVFNTNYKAAFNISQIVARDLIRRKKPGAIANISSISAMKHMSGLSVYGPSKAALDSLTKYMALELGPQQIRVNSVNPTAVHTDMSVRIVNNHEARNKVVSGIPLGRLCEKQDVADAVLFLLSDSASFVNGVNMRVDGGHSL